MEKIAISIGAFIVRPRPVDRGYPSVEEYLAKGFTVVAYDPRKDVYEEYLTIKDENFSHYQVAVVVDDSKKEAILKVIKGRNTASKWKSNRKGDDYMGSTLHCSRDHNFEDDPRFEGIVDEYPVKLVSIRSILEKYSEIEELHLVCEGEEIPIILETPIDLLLRCRVIVSCFFWEYPYFHQTEEMEKKCIDKLSKYYIVEQIPGTQRFKFERKDNG